MTHKIFVIKLSVKTVENLNGILYRRAHGGVVPYVEITGVLRNLSDELSLPYNDASLMLASRRLFYEAVTKPLVTLEGPIDFEKSFYPRVSHFTNVLFRAARKRRATTSEFFVDRICNYAGLSDETRKKAYEILKKYEKSPGILTAWHQSRGAAAAYLAGLSTGEFLTQRKAAQLAFTNEVALERIYHRFLKLTDDATRKKIIRASHSHKQPL